MRHVGLTILAVGFVWVSAQQSCDAQLRIFDQIAQRPFRALGHGTGPGYHRCNPGPDSSYYNPWSQTNSFLISRSPEYLQRFGYEDRSPLSLLRSGQSAFLSTAPVIRQRGFHNGQTVPLNADFVPSKKFQPLPTPEGKAKQQEPTQSSENQPTDNDSNKADDTFESEADSIDRDSESENEVGSLGDTAGTLKLPSVFLPASQPGKQ